MLYAKRSSAFSCLYYEGNFRFTSLACALFKLANKFSDIVSASCWNEKRQQMAKQKF